MLSAMIVTSLTSSGAFANPAGSAFSKTKNTLYSLVTPESDVNYKNVSIKTLSSFSVDNQIVPEPMPVIGQAAQQDIPKYHAENASIDNTEMGMYEAIALALQRNPSIAERISSLDSQNANIDVARAGYYPQISGGISTGDLDSSNRDGQVFSVDATQMLYDFGKVKTEVAIERAGLQLQQAEVLLAIDQVARETASAIVNIKRYQILCQIQENRIRGLRNIFNIAELRSAAGISSQADTVQAQSYVESAESDLITQQISLKQYQQVLQTLLGRSVSKNNWSIPSKLVKESRVFDDISFNTIPSLMIAQSEVEVAQAQKKNTKLSNYPTISLVGSMSQANNTINPSSDEEDGFDSSVKLEVSSNIFQGGAVGAQIRSASHNEEAAKAKVRSTYLDILEQTRLIVVEISNKQKMMNILEQRMQTTVKTKDIYQEQYKLGTRSVIDLLNAEESVHSARIDYENAKYDIFANLVEFIETVGYSREAYHLQNIAIQGFQVEP